MKEGFLARGVPDWRPAGVVAPAAGISYYKQHGHMVAFGVPKGAVISGSPAFDAGTWRRSIAAYPKLPDLVKTVRQLEKRIAEMEAAASAKP